MKCLYPKPEDDYTPVHVAMRCPNNMYPVPQIMCTLHVTLCTKWELLPFWNPIFTIKCEVNPAVSWQMGNCKDSPHQVNSEFTSQNYQVTSVSKLLFFPCFSMSVARCYNGWHLNFEKSALTSSPTTGQLAGNLISKPRWVRFPKIYSLA